MTFLAFPSCDLPVEAASLILLGGSQALRDNGCTIVGGHTVEDREIKFGLAVTGTVHPDEVITNSGAAEGDLIYLTKPLGTGIAATALKGEMLPPTLEKESSSWMKKSNGPGAQVMRRLGIRSATDVTGFGLLGHLWEMCQGSGLGAALELEAIPFMTDVLDMVMIGMVPEGAYRNRDYLKDRIAPAACPEERLWPLYDPQTSGGLLMAVPPEKTGSLERALDEVGVSAYRIGLFRTEPGIALVKGRASF